MLSMIEPLHDLMPRLALLEIVTVTFSKTWFRPMAL